MTNHPTAGLRDRRAMLQAAVDHLDHVLPGQAPILNFVHHNTLHGYQHLHFTDALAEAAKMTGIRPFLSDEEFRRLYRLGRIDAEDVDASLDESEDPGLGQMLATCADRRISRREVWRVALTSGIESLSAEQLVWRIEHEGALDGFQEDVPETLRSRLMSKPNGGPASTSAAVRDLWRACLSLVAAVPGNASAEDTLEQSGARLASSTSGQCALHGDAGVYAQRELVHLFDDVGSGRTLRGLLQSLTGSDLLDDVRPWLIRFCAAHLDEGLAAWTAPDRHLGLYASWRRYGASDLTLTLAEFPGWSDLYEGLPEQSVDAVMFLLQRTGIPEPRWSGYLQRLALEIPGWSGIINWRQQRPRYAANAKTPASLMDYLAIRLFLDKLLADKLCRQTWGIAGRFDELEIYAKRNPAELWVRFALYAGRLPEYLASTAQALADRSWNERGHREEWQSVAGHHLIAMPGSTGGRTAHGDAWRLFRLIQHLGLTAHEVRTLSTTDAENLLGALDALDEDRRSFLWLCSYERHYRNRLFAALTQNHGRAPLRREARPQAQIIFCMDDREESIRRHLEELNPALETLGAAGFFGVAMNWRGLDDTGLTPLCPVVVTPVHEVAELPRHGQEQQRRAHDRRLRLLGRLETLFNQELRRNLLSSALFTTALAPAVLPALTAKVFTPRLQASLVRRMKSLLVPAIATRLAFSASPHGMPASPQEPRFGFTDEEQADRVAAFLRNVGLTSHFAPLVVLSGHGSISQNNPHLAAYDCGACSGRHGGPNARAFAAMANRAEVRHKVAERGIDIPEDTWFLGTEHNTCDEAMTWYDLEELPRALVPALQRLRGEFEQARLLSAHERCRRFASAPRNPRLRQALRHVVGRAGDFSQARPELGHATNAAAIIGRRGVSRGTFLDRRVFLISYDPTIDPEGNVLEGILLAAGPVGAGINLEYYFSTVDNERFGCGTKVPHNVTGLFAVMEGASSDLRTGLPRQMIEIHEAMRLQVIVEAEEEVLAAIYQRQPPLRELIGNGWIVLSAIHPRTGAITVFDPRRGFVPWTNSRPPLPIVARSSDWYSGHTGPRPPALIETGTAATAAFAAQETVDAG